MSAQVVGVLLGAIGMGGIGGAVLALVKLPSEKNTQAVVDTIAASAEWKKLYDDAIGQRDYWRDRALAAERELEALRD